MKTEALGRSAGPVQNVIMALPHARSWRAIREELKRCFSDQTSLGHVGAQLENMTQKPNEPLRLYISIDTQKSTNLLQRGMHVTIVILLGGLDS